MLQLLRYSRAVLGRVNFSWEEDWEPEPRVYRVNVSLKKCRKMWRNVANREVHALSSQYSILSYVTQPSEIALPTASRILHHFRALNDGANAKRIGELPSDGPHSRLVKKHLICLGCQKESLHVSIICTETARCRQSDDFRIHFLIKLVNTQTLAPQVMSSITVWNLGIY